MRDHIGASTLSVMGIATKKQSSRLFERLRAAGTASLVIGWTALGSPMLAQAQPTDPVGQQAAMAAADYGQTTRCAGWLSPLDMEALRLAAEETSAIAKSHGLAIPDSPLAKPCSDVADRARVTAAAQDFSNTLLLRAQALAAMTDPVGFQLATTYEQKVALDTAADRLKAEAWAAGRGAVFDQLAARQRQEARVIAALTCASRQSVRSPKARPCPALPPEAQANVPTAMAMLAFAEAFSQSLATEMAAAAPPPMIQLWQLDRILGEFDDGYTLVLDFDKPSTTCATNQQLLHLADERAVRGSGELGDVLYAPTIRPDGQAAPVWSVIVMLKADEQDRIIYGPTSRLRAVRVVQMPDWVETRIRDTESNPALHGQWVEAALRAAVADVITGEQVAIYRRCG